MTEYLGTPLLW